jgi:DNA-directed RNA polymerase specialized sigma subunit
MADRVSVEDDERSGRPSTNKTTENVQKVRELTHEDRSRNELADTVGISYEVCQEILTENSNMHCIATKFVSPV